MTKTQKTKSLLALAFNPKRKTNTTKNVGCNIDKSMKQQITKIQMKKKKSHFMPILNNYISNQECLAYNIKTKQKGQVEKTLPQKKRKQRQEMRMKDQKKGGKRVAFAFAFAFAFAMLFIGKC